MFNTDIATGKISTAGGTTYSSSGPSTVFDIRNAVPVHPHAECYLWDVFQTCTPDQKDMLKNGTAILKDYIMIGFHLADGTGTAQYYRGAAAGFCGGGRPRGGRL
jgi:carboxypeptidase D